MRHLWDLDEENYDRYPGLDEWLEFGFPTAIIEKRDLVIMLSLS